MWRKPPLTTHTCCVVVPSFFTNHWKKPRWWKKNVVRHTLRGLWTLRNWLLRMMAMIDRPTDQAAASALLSKVTVEIAARLLNEFRDRIQNVFFAHTKQRETDKVVKMCKAFFLSQGRRRRFNEAYRDFLSCLQVIIRLFSTVSRNYYFFMTDVDLTENCIERIMTATLIRLLHGSPFFMQLTFTCWMIKRNDVDNNYVVRVQWN